MKEDKIQRHNKFQTKVLIALVILPVFSSGLIILFQYFHVSHQLRESARQKLLEIAKIAAMQVDVDSHIFLSDSSQERSIPYFQIQYSLQILRAADKNIQALYTIREKEGNFFFIVDSETDQTRFAHIGDPYPANASLVKELSSLNQAQIDQDFIKDNQGIWLSAYTPLYTSNNQKEAVLVIKQDASSIIALENKYLKEILVITGVIVLVIVLASRWLAATLAKPLVSLTAEVDSILEGGSNQYLEEKNRDEFSRITGALNTLSNQLATQAKELEIQKNAADQRGIQLQAISEIGQLTTISKSFVDWKDHIIRVIHERFKLDSDLDLDLDEKVDEGRLMGRDFREGSTVSFELRSPDRKVGTLILKNPDSNYAKVSDQSIIQTIANQIALAYDYAQLQIQNQKLLDQQTTKVDAKEQLKDLTSKPVFGYYCDEKGISPYKNSQEYIVHSGLPALALPIQVRGKTLGYFEAHKPSNLEWTKDELNLIQALVQQLGLALESARLYEETQRRAERERLVSKITAKLRSTNDEVTILQTAVSELRQALHANRVQVLIHNNQPNTPDPGSGDNGFQKRGT